VTSPVPPPIPSAAMTTAPTETAPAALSATPAPQPTSTPVRFHAMAALSAKGRLEPFEYEPVALGDHDVEIAVTHCGLCHSDVHLVDDDWGISRYPLVPGHEVVGRIVARGRHVAHLAPGDLVGVGWMRRACLHCPECLSGNEQLCAQAEGTSVGHFGGCTDRMRVAGDWAFRLPGGLEPATVAPLLCGGLTVYGALRSAGVRSAMRVAVCGLGGLGHLAVRFARAMGCEVTVFSGSADKREDALAMGAHRFVAPGCGEGEPGREDIVLATAPAADDWNELLRRLRPDGTLVVVGPVGSPVAIDALPLVAGRRRVMGSATGGRWLMLEMLGFAARHGIVATVERFPFAEAAAALDRVREGKARYRVVLERTP
jgi:uncharacterized zinc-type alcohol dehydrogenase-like protein